jgi:hypothetical protein
MGAWMPGTSRKPSGKGLPPEKKQPQPGWHYLQVVKHREGGRVVEVKVDVIKIQNTCSSLSVIASRRRVIPSPLNH